MPPQEAWEAGVENHVAFWAGVICNGPGLEAHHQILLEWCDPERAVEQDLAMLVPEGEGVVRALDLGSGPAASMGWKIDGRSVEVTAVDPFALYLNDVFEFRGLKGPPVRSMQTSLRSLADFNQGLLFDIAYLNCSLSTFADPVQTVRDLLAQLKPGGAILIRSPINGAAAASYFALHLWNLEPSDDGDISIWRPDRRHSLRDAVNGLGFIEAQVLPQFLNIVIRRTDGEAPVRDEPTIQQLSEAVDAEVKAGRLADAMRMAEQLRRRSTGASLVVALTQSAAAARQAHRLDEVQAHLMEAKRVASTLRSCPASVLAQLAYALEREGLADAAQAVSDRIQPRGARLEISRAIAERRAWGEQTRRRFAALHAPIVPLGQECIPFDVAMRWGLADRVVDGPFTAGVFYGDGPAKLIANGFSDLFDPAAHKIARTPSGVEALTLPAYGAFLNHQLGPYWLENDKSRLIDLYRERVTAFAQAVASPSVLFVLDQRYPADLDLWAGTLEDIVGQGAFRLLVVRFADIEGPAPTDPRIDVAVVPKPSADYVWFDAATYSTPAGLMFERGIVGAMASSLARLSS